MWWIISSKSGNRNPNFKLALKTEMEVFWRLSYWCPDVPLTWYQVLCRRDQHHFNCVMVWDDKVCIFGLGMALVRNNSMFWYGLVRHHLSSWGGISEMLHSLRRPSRQHPLRLRWSLYWRRGGRKPNPFIPATAQPFQYRLHTVTHASLVDITYLSMFGSWPPNLLG